MNFPFFKNCHLDHGNINRLKMPKNAKTIILEPNSFFFIPSQVGC